jgi:hypothetical protein
MVVELPGNRRRATPRDAEANHRQQVTTSADKAPTQFFSPTIRAKGQGSKGFSSTVLKNLSLPVLNTALPERPGRDIQRKRLITPGFR